MQLGFHVIGQHARNSLLPTVDHRHMMPTNVWNSLLGDVPKTFSLVVNAGEESWTVSMLLQCSRHEENLKGEINGVEMTHIAIVFRK
jgi:hypothetical protein